MAPVLVPRRCGPIAASPVKMVGAHFHLPKNVRVQVLAIHALEMRTGHDVPEVADHAIGDEHLPVVIEIQPPGIGGAVGDDLELPRRRVVAPDTAVHRRALIQGDAGLAHADGRLNSVVAVEPTIRSPCEAVDNGMSRLDVEAVENDLRWAVGNIVAVFIGNEQ